MKNVSNKHLLDKQWSRRSHVGARTREPTSWCDNLPDWGKRFRRAALRNRAIAITSNAKWLPTHSHFVGYFSPFFSFYLFDGSMPQSVQLVFMCMVPLRRIDYTVKPLLGGHPRDWANWPLNRGSLVSQLLGRMLPFKKLAWASIPTLPQALAFAQVI